LLQLVQVVVEEAENLLLWEFHAVLLRVLEAAVEAEFPAVN
jgi:hypothetical protein